MAQKKMTAQQKKEQAAKQKKLETIILVSIGAALILALILVAIFVGVGEKVTTSSGDTHVHDENCNHGIEETQGHVHDENCDHGTEATQATQPPVTRENGGDGATLETAKATHYITIEIENYGTLKGELYGDTVPYAVNQIVSLAQSGFYDGLTFHRIIEGFMMQGGEPKADSPEVAPIQGEFASNGIENNLLHLPGVLSMARTGVNDSATSQFFIMHKTSPHLDGDYAAFGRITEGMEIVDKICAETENIDGNGGVAAEQQPVIKSFTVTEA